MPNLNIRFGRLKLDNPIIVAPGHITRTFENIERADRYGAGAISIKTTLLVAHTLVTVDCRPKRPSSKKKIRPLGLFRKVSTSVFKFF